jgi:hypothetical protein
MPKRCEGFPTWHDSTPTRTIRPVTFQSKELDTHPPASLTAMTLADALEHDRLRVRLRRTQSVLDALGQRELRRSEDGASPEALRLAIVGFRAEVASIRARLDQLAA